MTHHLQPNTYQRSTSWAPFHGGRRVHGVAAFGVLIGVSVLLTTIDKLQLAAAASLRTGVEDLATPLLRVLTGTVAPLLGTGRVLAEWQALADDRNRLRDENDRLKSWEARARTLERQTVALTELAHVVEEAKLPFVTARVVSGSGGPFVRVALLDAGREQGVKPGYPVLSAQGLVGRVIAAGSRSARLLLVTDYNSRIPVAVGANAVRAIMQGDNGALPKLAYLQQDSRIKPGDEVVTSGVGGLYPRGLRVGTVVDTGQTMRVEPAARLERLDYISVLFYETLAATLSDEERATEARAGLSKRSPPTWPTSAEGGIAR